MNRLQRLHDAGVSIWLDTLSRDLLESGEFAGLVDDFAVSGATSNPTIFAKAITGSERYDDQLRSLLSAGVANRAEAARKLSSSTATPRPRVSPIGRWDPGRIARTTSYMPTRWTTKARSFTRSASAT